MRERRGVDAWEFRKIFIWGGGDAMHMRERFFFFN